MDPIALQQILQAQAASFQQAIDANTNQTGLLIQQMQQNAQQTQEQLQQVLQNQGQQIAGMQHQIQNLTVGQQNIGAVAAAAAAQPQQAAQRQQVRMDTDEQADIRSIIDPKAVDKIDRFGGEDAGWPDYRFDVESTALLLGPEHLLALALEAPEDDLLIYEDTDDADDIRKAKAMWYLLSKTCKGKARTILQTCPKGCGFLAWKRLCAEYSPKVAGRWSAMFLGLLHPEWDSSRKSFFELLTLWEKDITEYESHSGKKFGGDERIATVTRYAPKANSGSVQLAAMQSGDGWHSFRTALLRAMRTTTSYTSTGIIEDPNAMDVGAITGKPGGGKGGKGLPCTICGKIGHKWFECFHREKGKGSKGGKAGDKSGKGKGKGGKFEKGKGSGVDKDTCNYCKKSGHWARDCRKKQRDEAEKTQQVGVVEGVLAKPQRKVGGIALHTESDSDETRYVCMIEGARTAEEQRLVEQLVSIDSGSDADTCPLEIAILGVKVPEPPERYQCVVGNKLETYGVYDVEFEFTAANGQTLRTVRRLTASNVSKCIFSLGSLEDEGLVISHDGRSYHLIPAGGHPQFGFGAVACKRVGKSYYAKAKVVPVKTVAAMTETGVASGPYVDRCCARDRGFQGQAETARSAPETSSDSRATDRCASKVGGNQQRFRSWVDERPTPTAESTYLRDQSGTVGTNRQARGPSGIEIQRTAMAGSADGGTSETS